MRVIILTLALTVLFACNPAQPKNHHVIVVVDITNSIDILPTKAELINHIQPYLLEPKDGIEIGIVYVTDVHRNTKKVLSLPTGSTDIFATELDRKIQTNAFEKQLDTLFQSIVTVKIGYDKSQIFKAINRELTYLSKQEVSGTKQLIVYSDLQENSSLFSVHTKHNTSWKLPTPELAEFIQQEISIPFSLQGVGMNIIHTQTQEAEVIFDKMLEVYQHIYEPVGLKIIADQYTKISIP